MTNRVTNKMLENRLAVLNSIVGFEAPLPNGTDGAYLLNYAYGSVALHRREGPGESKIIGYCKKRELLELMEAYMRGLSDGMRFAEECAKLAETSEEEG